VQTGSPAGYVTILNASDVTLPAKANIVETTNFGDAWVRRFPTLLDMGNITFKVFFIPTEPTHDNATSSTASGLRYLMLNKVLSNFKLLYPDTGASSDTFPAYVTEVSITGKVNGVFEGSITLSNSGPPTLA
jgi:hypothetical protein